MIFTLDFYREYDILAKKYLYLLGFHRHFFFLLTYSHTICSVTFSFRCTVHCCRCFFFVTILTFCFHLLPGTRRVVGTFIQILLRLRLSKLGVHSYICLLFAHIHVLLQLPYRILLNDFFHHPVCRCGLNRYPASSYEIRFLLPTLLLHKVKKKRFTRSLKLILTISQLIVFVSLCTSDCFY